MRLAFKRVAFLRFCAVWRNAFNLTSACLQRQTEIEPMLSVSAPFRHFSLCSLWFSQASLHFKKTITNQKFLLPGKARFCLSLFLLRQGKAHSEYRRICKVSYAARAKTCIQNRCVLNFCQPIIKPFKKSLKKPKKVLTNKKHRVIIQPTYKVSG